MNARKVPTIMPGPCLVRFTKHSSPYNPGEVAGFNAESAAYLINVLKVGIAVTYNKKTGEYLVPDAPADAAPTGADGVPVALTDAEYAEIDAAYKPKELVALAKDVGITVPKDIKSKKDIITFLHEKGVFAHGGSDTRRTEGDETGADTGEAGGSGEGKDA